MPSSPHRTIKIRKVNPRPDGTIDAVEPERDEGWLEAVFNDQKADASRTHAVTSNGSQRLFRPACAGLIAALFSCASCGILTDPDEDQKAAMIAAQVIKNVNKCNADYAPGFAQSALARTNCINEAIGLIRPLYPYPDLLDFYLSNRRATAEKFSSGRITLAKANEEFNEQRLKMISEERRRSPEGNSGPNSVPKPRHSTFFEIVFKSPRVCGTGDKSVDCI